MVATCAHLLAALQWRLIDAELDADAEIEVTHDRQADGLRPRQGARCKARAAHGARREARDASDTRRKPWARVHDIRVSPIRKRIDTLRVSLSYK